MKSKSFCLVIISVLHFVFACDEKNNDTANITIEANINNHNWKGSVDSSYCELIPNDHFNSGYAIYLHSQGDSVNNFFISVPIFLYPLPINIEFCESDCVPWIEIETNGKEYGTYFSNGNLQIIDSYISNNDNNYKAEGSFEVVLLNKLDFNDSLVVKNGIFNIQK